MASLDHLPKELPVREATLVHFISGEILTKFVVVLNQVPDVLDSELVPVVWRVGVDNVARLVGLLLATEDLLEEVESTKLPGWKVEPHYSVRVSRG